MKSCFSVVVMSNTIQVALSKSISLSVISAPKDLAFPQIKFHWKPRSWWCGRLKHCCTNCFSIHFNEPAPWPPWPAHTSPSLALNTQLISVCKHWQELALCCFLDGRSNVKNHNSGCFFALSVLGLSILIMQLYMGDVTGLSVKVHHHCKILVLSD